MSDTAISTGSEPAHGVAKGGFAGIFSGKQGRRLRETLLAYAFLLPAFLIIFTFGLFPLIFTTYESTLRGLNKIVGRYDGLSNYVRAIDNLTYVLGFWIAVVLVYLAIQKIRASRELSAKYNENSTIWLLPGLIIAIAIALLLRFVFTSLPNLLTIPEKLPRGTAMTQQLFIGYLGEVWRLPEIQSSFWLAIAVLAVAAIVAYFYLSRGASRSPRNDDYYANAFQFWLYLIGAGFLAWFTFSEVNRAIAEALAEGETLDIWTQVLVISAGILLLLLSWFLWKSAANRDSNSKTFWRLGGAAALAVGAWVLIGELPAAIGSGNQDWWEGLLATVFFAALTIPMQFILSLTLATILFQDIVGKTAFRMIYFLPYIAPLVGTAAAFRIIFSGRSGGPINTILTSLGFDALGWLNEPRGIFELLTGQDLPILLAGPSLALIVIVLYNVWTYVGFDMVIFMAGLGSISKELYEAASIDGAGRWEQFRNVTLPLLSPTIYFLMLLAVIGTFKAFNRIYVMRLGAALGTTDTASVVIFQAFNRENRYGYASALAILLLLIIIILTTINNRLAKDRVFYG